MPAVTRHAPGGPGARIDVYPAAGEEGLDQRGLAAPDLAEECDRELGPVLGEEAELGADRADVGALGLGLGHARMELGRAGRGGRVLGSLTWLIRGTGSQESPDRVPDPGREQGDQRNIDPDQHDRGLGQALPDGEGQVRGIEEAEQGEGEADAEQGREQHSEQRHTPHDDGAPAAPHSSKTI